MQKIVVYLVLFSCFCRSWSSNLPHPSNVDTVNSIQYDVDLSKVQLARPFSVSYTMPDHVEKILEISPNFESAEETDVSVLDIDTNVLKIEVVPYGITNYSMPSLEISVLEKNGQTNNIYTPSFDIPISSSPIKKETDLVFVDVEPPYFVWDHLWTFFMLFLGLLIVLFFFILRRKRVKTSPVQVVRVNPYETIRYKLKELDRRSKSLDDLNQKLFFVDLSEAIREFLSKTIIPLAMELPSRELIHQLKSSSKDEDLIEAITFIIHTTDRAKYAKQVFGEERVYTLMKESLRAVDLLEKTIAEPEHEL